jgi:hypothetical protein
MYDLDNYRGITLTSNVYKLYVKIIEQSVMSYMEDNGILDPFSMFKLFLFVYVVIIPRKGCPMGYK